MTSQKHYPDAEQIKEAPIYEMDAFYKDNNKSILEFRTSKVIFLTGNFIDDTVVN